MTRLFAFASLSFVGLALATEITPIRPQPGDPVPVLRDSLQAWIGRNKPTGIVVGVISHGKTIYLDSFGTRRLGSTAPIGRRTIFHLASVTKPFVATSIVQLAEQGKIAIDSPVVRYLPYFKVSDPASARITVLELLNHTSGMKDVTDYRWDHPEYDPGSLERYIRGLADSALRTPPGLDQRYSNIGFEILADVVAKVSGESFEEYVQRHILTPLGMAHSTLLMSDIDSANMATGHVRRGQGREPAVAEHYPYNRRHAGSSTLHSNIEDMLRWAYANLQRGELDGKRILQAKSYDRLWGVSYDLTARNAEQFKRAGVPMPFTSTGIGLSWFLGLRNGHLQVWHGGGDTGFRSYLLLSPDDSSAVAMMVNDEGGNPTQVAHALVDALAGR